MQNLNLQNLSNKKGENHCDFVLVKDFLDMTPKHNPLKKVDKFNFIKIKNGNPSHN